MFSQHESVLRILSDLKKAQNEIDAKYRVVSMLTGLSRSELEALGGF